MRKVFISHSSLDRELTREVSAAVGAAPPAGGAAPCPIVDYDVLVDYEKLVAGKVWPRQLHEWMAKCHAGLLLLTTNAAASPWVLKEATILSWRLSLDNDFHLFVVRFPGVTDELLEKEKFSPLDLDRIQRIATTEPAEIARVLRDTLGSGPPPKTLFDHVVTALASHLSEVRVEMLRDIAEAVRVEPPAWKPGDGRAQYVEEIARRLLSESLGRYQGVNEFLDELQKTTVTTETLREVLRIVAPHWVDGTAAGVLPPLTRRTPRGIAGMNGMIVPRYTARMYVSRAHPLSRAYEYIPVLSRTAGDFVEHVTQEICKWIRRRENEDKDKPDDEIVADIASWPEPVYVALPPPEPIVSKGELDALQAKFPTVTFILSTGRTLEPAPDLGHVSWLEPPLDIALEATQAKAFAAAERIISRKAAGR